MLIKNTPSLKLPEKKDDLFGEDTDEDDIFSMAKPVPIKKPEPVLQIPTAVIKNVVPRKLASDESDEDEPFKKKEDIKPTPVLSTTSITTKKPPASSDEDDDLFETAKPIPKSQPPPLSSATIPNTTKTSKLSDDEDPLSSKPSLPPIVPPPAPMNTKPTSMPTGDSDSDDIFTPKKSSQTTATKTTIKPLSSDDDDDILSPKKPPQTSTTKAVKPITKPVLSDDDDDNILPSKKTPQTTTGAKLTTQPVSSDDDIVSSKQPAQTIKTPISKLDTSSDDDILSSKKSPQTFTTTAVKPTTKPVLSDDDDDDDAIFGKAKKTATLPQQLTKAVGAQLPPPVKLPPPVTSTSQSNDYVDPLGLHKPDEPIKISSMPAKKQNLSDDDSDNDTKPEKELNPGALDDNEKPNVKKLLVRHNSFSK